MTALLLRLFAKNGDNRSAVGKLSGIVGIACNLLLFALKLTVGTLAGAVSITADAMNNLSDATSSIVTLLGFRLAEKPADAEHPYGHARFEYLSGLAVAAIIVVIGVELAKGSFDKMLHPTPVSLTLPMVLVLVASVGLKFWMSRFNIRLGKLIQSETLLATAADSRNDVIATSAVLVAGVIEALTNWRIDGYMGLGVALFILYSGAMLGKETISPLLGETASPELRELIVRTVSSDPRVLGYHDLMVHDYGPGQRFASIHVEMDQREDPLDCHELIDEMERTCLNEHNVHLVIHYDPVVTGDPELDRMKELVNQILSRLDERITIHDFRMVRGKSNTNLIFDIVLPAELMLQRQEIKAELDRELVRQDHRYHTVVTFDMG